MSEPGSILSLRSTLFTERRKPTRTERKKRKLGKVGAIIDAEKKRYATVKGIGEKIAVLRTQLIKWMPSAINSIAWSHDSSKFALGRANGQLQIYEFVPTSSRQWHLIQIMCDPRGYPIDNIIWTHSGEILTSSPLSSEIMQWNISQTPQPFYDLPGGGIWVMSLSKDGELLAVVSEDARIRLFNLSSSEEKIDIFSRPLNAYAFPGHLEVGSKSDLRIISMTWNNDRTLITGSSLGDIVVWDEHLKVSQIMNLGSQYSGIIWSLVSLSTDDVVAVGDSKGQVTFWNIKHGTLLMTHRVHDGEVLSLHSSPDHQMVVAAGVDPTIHCFTRLNDPKSSSSPHNPKTWVWTTGAGMSPLTHNRLEVRSMSISPNGKFLVIGGLDPDAICYQLEKKKEGWRFKRFEMLPFADQIVKSEIFSSSPSLLSFKSGTHAIEIWDFVSSHERPSNVLKLLFDENKEVISAHTIGNSSLAVAFQSSPIRLWKKSEHNIWEEAEGIHLPKIYRNYPIILLSFSGEDKFIWVVQKSLSDELVITFVDLLTMNMTHINNISEPFSPNFIRANGQNAVLGSSLLQGVPLLLIHKDMHKWLQPPIIKSHFNDVIWKKDGSFISISTITSLEADRLGEISGGTKKAMFCSIVALWKDGEMIRMPMTIPLALPLSSRSTPAIKGACLLDDEHSLIIYSDRIYRSNIDLLLNGNESVDVTKIKLENLPMILPLILSTPRSNPCPQKSLNSILFVQPLGNDQLIVIERPLEEIYGMLPPAFRRLSAFGDS